MGRAIRCLGQLLAVGVVVLGLSSPAVAALSAPVERGLGWLAAQVQADGTVAAEAASGATPLQARSEVETTLRLLGSAQPALTEAVGGDPRSDTEALARRIIALARSGGDSTALLNELGERQLADGGLPSDANHNSNALDTAWALAAWKSQGSSGEAVQRAVSYLVNSINEDGGFSASVADPASDLYTTAQVVEQLQRYSQTFAIAATLEQTRLWLLSAQSDGSYRDSLENAVAALALLAITPDASQYGGAINALLVAQQADGSWEGDLYITALALRALFLADGGASATSGALRFSVVDANSQQPLYGAVAQLSELGLQAQSNSDGLVTLNEVAAGSYSLTLAKAGYSSVVVSGITVAAGEITDLGEIALAPQAGTVTLRGVVQAADSGAALATATVVVAPEGGSAEWQAVTDSQGQFELAGVPAGTLLLSAAKPGYESASVTLSASADQVVELGVIALSPLAEVASVRGVITDGASGLPLADAQINLTLAGELVTTLSAADGRYELTGLAPGSATIEVTKTGYSPVSASAELVGGMEVIFSPSLYTEGSSPTDATLRGEVVDGADGSAIAGALVTVGSATTTSAADGSFQLASLATGPFAISVVAADYAPLSATGSLAPGLNDVGQLALTQSALTSTLSGVITDTLSGMPLSGVVVTELSSGRKAVTGSDGRYRLTELTERELTLSISVAGYHSRILLVSLPAIGSHTFDVELTPSAASAVTISEVGTNASYYLPEEVATGWITLNNSSGEEAEVTVRVLVINAQGEIIREIQPVPGLGDDHPPDLPVAIPAAGSKDVPFEWFVHGTAAGYYQLLARASDLEGRVVAERGISVRVDALNLIGGGITLDPPITQVGTTPVAITATVVNKGNLPLAAGNVQVEVILESADTSDLSSLVPTLKGVAEGAPLNRSRGAVFDAAGNLYFLNPTERAILRLATDGTITPYLALSVSEAPNPLQDLAFNSAGQLLVIDVQDRLYTLAPGAEPSYVTTGLATQQGIALNASGQVFISGTNAQGEVLTQVAPQSGATEVLVSNGLATPYGAVADAAGNLYVTNYGDNSLVKVRTDGVIVPFVEGLDRPRGLTRDSAGNLYVANSGDNTIVKVTPTGALSVYASGLANPYDLRFDGTGNLLVVNSGDNSIAKVDPAGQVSQFAKSIAFSPEGMRYDSAGNLYVANEGDGTLTKMAADGVVSVLTTQLAGPRGVAVAATDDVYVASATAGAITHVTSSGTTTLSSGLATPYGVALDDSGQLFVSESGADQISQIDRANGAQQVVAKSAFDAPVKARTATDGTTYVLDQFALVRLSAAGSEVVVPAINSGVDFAFDGSGGFWVLDGASFLRHYDAAGQQLASYHSGTIKTMAVVPGDAGIYFGDFTLKNVSYLDAMGNVALIASLSSNPILMAADPAGTLVVVLNNGEIVRVAPTGSVSPITTLPYVKALTIAEDGTLYLARSGVADWLWVMDPFGTLITSTSGRRTPAGLDFTNSGDLLLVETNLRQLTQFGRDGTLKEWFNGFHTPKDLVWSGTELTFAADRGLYTVVPGQWPRLVQELSSLNYLSVAGGDLYYTLTNKIYRRSSGGNGVLWATATGVKGIAAHPAGGMAYGTNTGHEVQVLDAAAQSVRSYIGLNRPEGLAIDGVGNLFVANGGHQNLIKISAAGTHASTLLSTGVMPCGMGFDSSGNLFYCGLPDGGEMMLYQYLNGAIKLLGSGGEGAIGTALNVNGRIYTIHQDGFVRQLDATARTLEPYAAGLGGARGIAVGPDQAIYIAGGSSSSVVRYSGGGVSLVKSDLVMPESLAFDADGGLYVGGASGELVQIDSSGSASWVQAINDLLRGKQLDGLAVADDGRLHIVSSSQPSIYQLQLPERSELPEAGSVVYTQQMALPALALGEAAPVINFGQWSPPFAGEFRVRLSAVDPQVDGSMVNAIHVGPHAEGHIFTDRTELAAGETTVGIAIGVQGADNTELSRSDPDNIERLVPMRTVFNAGVFRSLAVDRDGVIYAARVGGIARFAPSENYELEWLAEIPTIANSQDNPVVVDQDNNVYVYDQRQGALLRITQAGVVTVVTPVDGAVMGLAINRLGELFMLGERAIYRVTSDGHMTEFNSSGVIEPDSLTIDGKDNLYVMNAGHIITKITPEGESSVVLRPNEDNEPIFEYEGVNIAGNCNGNLFLKTTWWKRFGQVGGEEHTLTQLAGGSYQVSSVFDARALTPEIIDIDHMVFDFYSHSLYFSNDATDSYIHRMPVLCGEVSVDLHIVLPPGQRATGFNIAPTAQIERADGATEYIWGLADDWVQQGEKVRFDTVLGDLVLGEERPLAQEAFLLFRNSFVPGEVRSPITIPSLPVTGLVALSVSSDKPAYPAHTNALIVADMANPNPFAVEGQLTLDLYDAAGVWVERLLESSATIQAQHWLSLSPAPAFNTGEYAAGSYRVEATLSDHNGVLLAQGENSFEITSGSAGQTELSATLAVDQASYQPYQPVTISSQITNLTANLAFADLTVVVSLKGPQGDELFHAEHPIAQLAGGSLLELSWLYEQTNGAAGSYQVELTILDAAGTPLYTTQTGFSVDSSEQSGAGLQGEVSVSSTLVPLGKPLTISVTLENQGNADITALPVTLRIVERQSLTEVAQWDYSVAVAMGATFSTTASWLAVEPVDARYLVLLTATLQGDERLLGQAGFQVGDRLVELDVDQHFVNDTRLLVLAGCGEALDDSKTSGLAACTEARAQAMDLLLSELAVEHRITTDTASFEQALRSGLYNTYWLSARIPKLPDTLAEELREAIFRGQGLLDDGDHDERNKLLDEVPGIDYQGKLGSRDQTITLSGGLFGNGELASLGQALKLVLAGGTQEATVPGNGKKDSLPAIVSRSYGDGRALLFGFDLMGSLTVDPRWRQLLVSALTYITPPAPTSPLVAGSYLTLNTEVTNRAAAVEAAVSVQLPATATTLLSDPQAEESEGVVQWVFPLAEGASETLRLAFAAPNAAGDYELRTELGSVEDGVVVPYGEPLILPFTLTSAGPTLVAARASLASLVLSNKQERRSLDAALLALSSAEQQLAAAAYAAAIDALIEAIDAVRAIESVDLQAVRRSLDDVLFEAQWRWFEVQ